MLYLLEGLVWILVAAFAVTQVVMPIIGGLPLFPLFRRERGLQDELAEAQEDVRVAEAESEIERTRRKAEARRAGRTTRPADPAPEQPEKEAK